MINALASDEVYEAYDFILPPKYDGGYLLIALYQRIQTGALHEVFSTTDIKQVIADIRRIHPSHAQQAEQIIRRLSHYIIRDEPGQPGRFRLTGHAKRLVRLLTDKIEKPYKNFPLHQTFIDRFTITANDYQSLDALRIKFDVGMVAQHKQVIYEHLETLQEELDVAHSNLEKILHNNELSPVLMAEQFAETFKAFGDRADDIASAIASKERFLQILNNVVDDFHHRLEMAGNPRNEEEQENINKLMAEWEGALQIQNDLEGFFEEVQATIIRIRRQIVFADDRLTELHENFTKKSQFQINLKRLLQAALKDAYACRGCVLFHHFPQKDLPFERLRLLYPHFYSFELPAKNALTYVTPDEAYIREQKQKLDAIIKRQKSVTSWVELCKRYLSIYGVVELHVVLNKILKKGADIQATIEVAYHFTRFAIADVRYQVWSSEPMIRLHGQNLYLWTTTIARNAVLTTS